MVERTLFSQLHRQRTTDYFYYITLFFLFNYDYYTRVKEKKIMALIKYRFRFILHLFYICKLILLIFMYCDWMIFVLQGSRNLKVLYLCMFILSQYTRHFYVLYLCQGFYFLFLNILFKFTGLHNACMYVCIYMMSHALYSIALYSYHAFLCQVWVMFTFVITGLWNVAWFVDLLIKK